MIKLITFQEMPPSLQDASELQTPPDVMEGGKLCTVGMDGSTSSQRELEVKLIDLIAKPTTKK